MTLFQRKVQVKYYHYVLRFDIFIAKQGGLSLLLKMSNCTSSVI